MTNSTHTYVHLHVRVHVGVNLQSTCNIWQILMDSWILAINSLTIIITDLLMS